MLDYLKELYQNRLILQTKNMLQKMNNVQCKMNNERNMKKEEDNLILVKSKAFAMTHINLCEN